MSQWPSQLVRYGFKIATGQISRRSCLPEDPSLEAQKGQGGEQRDRKGERKQQTLQKSVSNTLEGDLSFLWTEGWCQGCAALRERAHWDSTARGWSYLTEKVSAVQTGPLSCWTDATLTVLWHSINNLAGTSLQILFFFYLTFYTQRPSQKHNRFTQ